MDARWWILISWAIVAGVIEALKFVCMVDSDDYANKREDLLLYRLWLDDNATIIGKVILTILIIVVLPLTTLVNVIWLISVKSETRKRKETEKRKDYKEIEL